MEDISTENLEGLYSQFHILFGGKINNETSDVLTATLADLAVIKGVKDSVNQVTSNFESEELLSEKEELNRLKKSLYTKLFQDIEQQYNKDSGKILFQVPLSHAADFIPELIARKTNQSTLLSQLDIEFIIINPESITGISGNEDEVRKLYNYYLKKIDGADKFIQIVDTADANATFVEDAEEKKGVAKVASDYQSELNRIGAERQNRLRLYFPTEEMAAKEDMTLKEFYGLYEKTISLNWPRITEANEELAELIREYDSVSITGPGTDISYDISGMGARNSVIQTNWPGSEVHTAPNREGVNGTITYDNEVYIKMLGETIPGIKFTFENGRMNSFEILKMDDQAEKREELTKKLTDLFDEEEGNRYLGELAFGTNFFVPTGIKHPLIGEKALGMHMAFGKSYNYKGVDNGNNDGGGIKTSFHWDAIKDMSDCTVKFHKEGKESITVMKNAKFSSKVLPKLASYQSEIEELKVA